MEKRWVRLRETCSVEGLLHLLENTGDLHMHLLALDMIPIAALVGFLYCSDAFRSYEKSKHPLAKCNLILQVEPSHEKGKPRDAIRKNWICEGAVCSRMDKLLRMGYPGEKVVLDGGGLCPSSERRTSIVHGDRQMNTQISGIRCSFISVVVEAAF